MSTALESQLLGASCSERCARARSRAESLHAATRDIYTGEWECMSEANSRLQNAQENWNVFLTCVGARIEEDVSGLLFSFSPKEAHDLDYGLWHALYGGSGLAGTAAGVVHLYGIANDERVLHIYDTLLGVPDQYAGLLSLATALCIEGPARPHARYDRLLLYGLTKVGDLITRYGDSRSLMGGLSTFSVRESELGMVATPAEMKERYDRVERSVLTLERAL